MGKVCSKCVLVPRFYKTHGGKRAAGPSYDSTSKPVSSSKNVVLRQISSRPSFCALEVHPPHSLLKKSIRDLPKTHKFYVSIYGLKARSLQLRYSRLDASLFCIVNWDDFSFERRTKKCKLQSNPKWGDTMHFYYSVPGLDKLSNRFLVIQVYEDTERHQKNCLLGQVQVPLSTIVSGPIHHDLILRPAVKMSGFREGDLGRLIFDIRMAQVCQLIVSPVEILVHLHESLDPLDELEVDGVGTKRLPATLTKTVPVKRFPASKAMLDAVRPDCNEESSNNKISDANLVVSLSPDPSQTPGIADSNEMHLPPKASDVGLPSDVRIPNIQKRSSHRILETQSQPCESSTRLTEEDTSLKLYSIPVLSALKQGQTPKEISTETRDTRQASKPLHSSPTDPSQYLTSTVGATRPSRTATARRLLEETLPEKGSDDEDVERTIENEAVGGHSESDALDPFLAEWQLTFVPTGVDNPFEYCSAWTPMSAQPYWNSVDHTVVDELMQAEGIASHLSTLSQGEAPPEGTSAQMFESDEKSSISKNNDIQCASVDAERRVETGFRKGLSRLPSFRPLASADSEQSPGHSSHIKKKHVLQHTPISVSEIKSLSAASQSNCGDKSKDAFSSRSLTNTGQTMVPISPAVLVHSMTTSLMFDRLDPQVTYRKLAAVCRRGLLVREMLYDDLPSIQLETICDFLRQSHLKLRLYAKRSGLHEPEFYGEAWLPFFKIYDADIVEQMHQNFSDAYFHEKLWFEGKCIGHIEGVIVFQNNPMVRQMVAGVHTDEGFMRISSPILGTYRKSLKSAVRGHQDVPPDEIQKISQLHQLLLDILYRKAQYAPTEVVRWISMRPATHLNRVKWLSFCQLLRKHKPAASAQTASVVPKDAIGAPAELNTLHASQQEFHDTCDQVLQMLRLSHVETRRCFLYRTQGSLLMGQQVFLNLASHVLEFVDYVPWQYRSTYNAILHHILRRGELDIGSCLPEPPDLMSDLDYHERYMLYTIVKSRTSNHAETSESQSGYIAMTDGIRAAPERPYDQKHSFPIPERVKMRFGTLSVADLTVVRGYHQRMKVCKHYYFVLHRVLHSCFIKLCNDSGLESQRKYLSTFLCILYFRLPSFRQQLLGTILTDEDRRVDIPEWRGTEFELNLSSLRRLEQWQSGSEYRLMLDWMPFHDALESYFGKANLAEFFKNWPVPSDLWKSVLSQRGPQFFSFLENWAKHVYQTIPRQQCLRWETLPGYASLLKALLIEMKSREVTRYPDALLNCSGAVLVNEKLLSVFIKILFLKTSVYKISAVFAALNYVDYWIQVLSLRNQPLPPNFDLHFLRRGLDIVLGSDIGLCVAKGLWFIYKNIMILQAAPLKVFLIDLLFQKYFFTLFLNWSWLVRRCFMWLLLYRVCESTRQLLMTEGGVVNEYKSLGKKSNTEPDTTGVSIKITGEQRVMGWGYLELCRYLDMFNGPEIFPKNLTTTHLRSFILNHSSQIDELASTDAEASTGTGSCEGTGRARSVSNYVDQRHNVRIADNALAKAEGGRLQQNGSVRGKDGEGDSFLSPGIVARRSASMEDSLTENSCTSVSLDVAVATGHSRLEAHVRDMLCRVQQLTQYGTPSTVPSNISNQPYSIPPSCETYIKVAIPEFVTELQAYRNWVACGASSIPAMNIPASPLDNNVDVPLDTFH